ncbi:MAG: ABC transporter permease [Planctomycetota bacterium]|jgi:ABC-2 type transport system permease protein
MRRVLTLARRELSAYFFSPIAYVLGGLFLLLVGMLFLWGAKIPVLKIDMPPIFRGGAESSLRPLFDVLAYGLVVIVPLLTMRLVAEEFRAGTIETLMTAPVTDTEVILGKFLGAMGLYLVLLAATAAFMVLVVIYGEPDWGVATMGYLGMVLLGSTYIAAGLFASTLTRHQLVAGLTGIGILAFFTLGIRLLTRVVSADYAEEVGRLNMVTYLTDFSKGVFDTRSLVFFLTATAFFLFLSVKVLESRRWR